MPAKRTRRDLRQDDILGVIVPQEVVERNGEPMAMAEWAMRRLGLDPDDPATRIIAVVDPFSRGIMGRSLLVREPVTEVDRYVFVVIYRRMAQVVGWTTRDALLPMAGTTFHRPVSRLRPMADYPGARESDWRGIPRLPPQSSRERRGSQPPPS